MNIQNVINKVRTITVFVVRYVVYLAKAFHWKTKQMVKLYTKYSIIAGVVLFLAIIALVYGKQIVKIITAPRPPAFSTASKSSGYQFQARDRRNNVTSYVGIADDNTPSVETKFDGGQSVNFVLSETDQNISKPEKSGNTITFKNVRSDVDLKYETLVDGLKESLIINSPQKGNAFTFVLNTNKITAEPIGTNIYSNAFYDEAGNFLFSFVKPFAFDANGERTDNVVLSINKTTDDPYYTVRVIVNQKWLEDPARVYPITVDPTITYINASQFSYGQFNHVSEFASDNTFASATGGTITTSGIYKIHTFTSSGTFDPNGAGNVEVLVVAGGGGGANTGSGGGGGGVIYNSSFTVTDQAYTVTVGNGGPGGATTAAPGTKGSDSVFSTITAEGGGYGVTHGGGRVGGSGGSGGGGSIQTGGSAPAGGSASAGYPGGAGFVDASWIGTSGGGGGAGEAGVAGCNTSGCGRGGNGKAFDISGSLVYYAGGGGAGEVNGAVVGSGGIGGGGSGTINSTGTNGTANTGGGGGGGSYTGTYFNGGSGGSGIVIIRYPVYSSYVTTNYQELATDQNTVGLWHMNEASGNVLDSSGNVNTGTPTGTSVVSGPLGNARDFNGSSDKISVANESSFDFERTSQFSIEAWVNTTSANQNVIFSKLDPSSPFSGYEFRVNPGGIIDFTLINTSGSNQIRVSTTTTVNDGKWHHVAVTYSGNSKASGVNIYIDGVSQGLTTTNDALTASTLNNITPYIGARTNGIFMNGLIDEVRVSAVARSAEEIRMSAQRRPYGVYTSDVMSSAMVEGTNLFAWTEFGVSTGDGETPKDATGLVAQWNFNETSGITAAVGAGSCGATCNGTLTGFDSTASQDANATSTWTANQLRWGGGALRFDGVNSTVSVGGETSFDFERTSPFSISGWIKTPGTTGQIDIFSKMANTAPYIGYDLYIQNTGTIGFIIVNTWSSNALAVNSIQRVDDNQWHLVTVTYDGSSNASGIKMYVDGKSVVTNIGLNSLSGTTLNNVTPQIGSRNNTAYYFNAVMDAVAVYSRALSDSEILSNYNAGNVEVQTRVGNTTDPNDATWDAWLPVTSESQITSLDGDQANWAWDLVATYMPKTKADDSNIKVEGTGSLKLTTGIPQADANTVALWHLDETGGAGAYIKDSTANANNGTPTGTTLVNGVSGKARSLNGSSDFVSMGQSLSSIFGGPFTVEMWVKPNSLTGDPVAFSNGSWTANGIYIHLLSTGGVRFVTNQSGAGQYSDSATGVVTINKWHHVAVVRNGASATFFVNGVNVTGSQQSHINPASTTYEVFLGKYNGGGLFFNGAIDEVRVSNIARSGEEIAEAYGMGANHRLSRTINSSDLSSSQKLSFNVAADRPGSYLETTAGNGAFANYEPDANTVGLWHLDDNAVPSSQATGGTITFNNGNQIHTFTTSGTFTPAASMNVEALVVGGGGGSGSNGGGGGGGGGVIYNASFPVTAQAYTVTVGGGGAGLGNNAQNGQNSVFSTITALGGGGGGSRDADVTGKAGGSGGGGGGSGSATSGGAGTAGQGNNGGAGFGGGGNAGPGGGGGCGAVGSGGASSRGGNGGNGCANSISGSSVYYGGGGGGGLVGGFSGTPGTGGLGGGGNGVTPGGLGNNGTANTGGGAGGNNATGGSGVVIIKIPNSVSDSSGNNNKGLVTGTLSSQGKIGKGRVFSANNRISVGTGINLANSSFTIDFWAKRSAAGVYDIAISQGASSANNGLHIGFRDTNTFTCDFYSNGLESPTYTDTDWHHWACTYDASSNSRIIYRDGQRVAANTAGADFQGTGSFIIGSYIDGSSPFDGILDEVRVSNNVRSPADIRTAYEFGKRSHEITIDFGAKLDSGNLITGSGDTSFTVDATYYGFSNKGSNLYLGDKIIVRENYDGTTYIAQGTVNGVVLATGAVTVSSWDSGGTFPSSGFTANADVFKWQREYFDLTGSLGTQRNGVTKLTLRQTGGNEGRNIWLDDIKSVGSYLSDPAGSAIASAVGKQYFQYRTIFSSNDYNVSSSVTSASNNFTSNAPNAPVMGVPSNITPTSIQWNFTSTGGGGAEGILGFKLVDEFGTIKATCEGPAISSCVEIGLTPNSSNIRRVVAYNSAGLSPYSLVTTGITLAALPAEPVLSSPTATSLVLTPYAGTNPANTEIAVYKIDNAGSCPATPEGVGGNYLKADGTSNGSTAVWLTAASWGNVTISGLDLENAHYVFCAKARNIANIETNWIGNAGNAGWISDLPEYTLFGSTSFATEKKKINGNNGSRKVVGLDFGPAAWWKFDDSPFTATGGNITYTSDYTIHTFTGNGTFTPNGSGNVEVLLVAGGGGGGSCTGAGGGGGGYIQTTSSVTGASYPVVVGQGGGSNVSGSNSTFNGLTAIGGGAGGSWGDVGDNGGSGGGGGTGGYRGTGTHYADNSHQGYNGGSGSTWTGGGGGGGAGNGADAGGTGGNGGAGYTSSISGASTKYSGGGGGGAYNCAGISGYGADGGGNGYCPPSGGAAATTTGSGGGGGGTSYGGSPCYPGGQGASGTVIIRYANPPTDTSGNSAPGVTFGTSVAEGKYGNARSFNGTTDYIKVADNNIYSFTDNKMTAEAWIKRSGNPAATEYIILKGTNGWEYGLAVNTNGTIYSILWQSGGANVASLSGQTVVTDGNWHHVAMVSTGSRLSVYIDGVEDDFSTGFTGSMSNTNAPLFIGDRSDQNNAEFEGQIDDVRIYHAPLSAHQIANDMNSSNPQNVSQLTVEGGVLTLMADETMAVGEIYMTGGSIALADGAEIKIGSPIWYSTTDTDADTYDSGNTEIAYVGNPPSTNNRKFLGVAPTGDADCNDADPNVHTTTRAVGGTITTQGSNIVHTFISDYLSQKTFAYNSAGNVEYMMVGGGGSGGGWGGGGGGGGGYIAGTTNLSATTYQVVIGNGGVGNNSNSPGVNGGNSTFNGLTAIGGGGGGGYSYSGSNGGSGGGGGAAGGTGAGTGSQGQSGGPGAQWTTAGGGGGYAGVGGTGNGTTAGTGGTGVTGSITGTRYSGGGGGGRYNAAGAAGVDGGGNGASESYGSPGTANTGGGGGGGKLMYGGGTGYTGGTGGSGIVVIRYPSCH